MNDNWPLYFKDRLIVSNIESCVGVATLWMPKESVASELDPDSFCVCGQLYTKRGINPLLRNLLSNPKITHLVLCGVDRQGSGEALLKFFERGLDTDSTQSVIKGWRVKDDEELIIDSEIDEVSLNLVRNNVQIYDMRMRPLGEVASFIKTLKSKEPYSEPIIFPEAEKITPTKFPSDMSVFKVRRDYIGDAWLDVLQILTRFGEEIEGMYGKVKEVHNLSVVIESEDPDRPVLPSFLKFRSDGLEKYYEGFFDSNLKGSSYTYGERIYDYLGINQCQIMIDKLSRFPYDRGALAVLWNPQKDNFPPSNVDVANMGQTKGWQVPCLVMILGQCLGEKFYMTAVFRNNDMYGGWPLNAFALRKLQSDICRKIGKSLGSLTTISHIAEIYEIDWDDAFLILKENYTLEKTCTYDPRGNYIIHLDGDDIVANFYSKEGDVGLAEIRINGKQPKAARDLCAMVMKDMLISELGAAMDFGRQVAKAENAVKLGLKFEQDQPLAFK